MTCPVCFFRDDHQNILKMRSFGIERFENKLMKYKEEFIKGVRQMDSQKNCSCFSAYSHNEMISWTDSFLNALKKAEGIVNEDFDSIISIYEDFIRNSQKKATDKLWSHLENKSLLTQTENPITYTKLIFRARKTNVSFNEKDIRQYFHIPFF